MIRDFSPATIVLDSCKKSFDDGFGNPDLKRVRLVQLFISHLKLEVTEL